jgi:hypothetical protein
MVLTNIGQSDVDNKVTLDQNLMVSVKNRNRIIILVKPDQR